MIADEVRQKAATIGFDANTGEFVDMFKAGIVDPTKVVTLPCRTPRRSPA